MSSSRKSDPSCPRCRGTGTRDTGGFQPWGDLIFEDCDCHVDYARSQLIDHQKDQFALEVAEQVILRAELAIWPADRVQLTADLKLLILDAVEFGIQLGGMGLKEGE